MGFLFGFKFLNYFLVFLFLGKIYWKAPAVTVPENAAASGGQRDLSGRCKTDFCVPYS